MIKEEINSSYKICCEIKDIELKENTCVLQATWKQENGTDFIDQKEIPTDRIRDYVEMTPPLPTEEAVVAETMATEESEEASSIEISGDIEEKEGKISSIVLIAIVAIALVIAVVVVCIVNSNKKKREEEERLQQEMFARAEAERLQAEKERAQREQQRAMEQARATVPAPAPVQKPKLPDITLKLIKLGTKKDEIIQLPICKECKFGRSKEKCDYAISEDKSLSSLHCTFIYRNKKVYLRDEKSTNGSFINGIPIEGEHELLQDDVIYIGSYKYRVMW